MKNDGDGADSYNDHNDHLWNMYESISDEMGVDWLDENKDVYCLDLDLGMLEVKHDRNNKAIID